MPWTGEGKLKESFKYPQGMNESLNDYISFAHFPYKINDSLYNKNGKNFNPIANLEGRVILYMPNSTPQTPQKQAWESKTFEGELGQVMKQAAQTYANTGSNMAFERSAGAARDADKGEVGKQFLLSKVASSIGLDAAAALQLGKGKVYNPNVEMLYKEPILRQFRFSFDFLPESPEDARATDNIIMMFKKYSAPKAAGAHLEVPHLWNIKYHRAGGKHFSRLNAFKYCICEAVMVQDNPRSNYHMTIDAPDLAGPVPVHTQMELIFTETDIILRDDHDNVGYARGY